MTACLVLLAVCVAVVLMVTVGPGVVWCPIAPLAVPADLLRAADVG